MIVTGWVVLGAASTALPWLDGSLLALALASVAGGFAAGLGMALNALIIEDTSGPERRTAFASQHVGASGGSSVGMLSGGAVIAVLGAEVTMHVAGVILVAVPLLLALRAGTSPRGREAQRTTGLGAEPEAVDARQPRAGESIRVPLRRASQPWQRRSRWIQVAAGRAAGRGRAHRAAPDHAWSRAAVIAR